MMQPVVLSEYKNQNRLRAYPFEDNATLRDTSGHRMPADFIIDAFIYLMDSPGRPYISSVDVSSGTITIATDKPVAYAQFDLESETAVVYEAGVYGRQVGMLVLGPGKVDILQGSASLEFTPEATAITPSAFITMYQEGVRGVTLDGKNLITGDVVFEGRDGVVCRSYIDNEGRNILRIDVIGDMPPDLEDCTDDCEPIREVCFQRAPGSRFMIDEYAPGVLSVTSYGFDLDDICEAQRFLALPNADGDLPPKPGTDPCEDDPIPPPPDDPGPEVEICFEMADVLGSVFIITPSGPEFMNAVGLRQAEGQEVTHNPSLQLPSRVNNAEEALRHVRKFTNPVSFSDSLSFYIKGLGLYRRTT